MLVGLVAASCVSPRNAEAQANVSVMMDKTNSWLRSTNFFRSNLFAGSGMTLTFGTNGSVTFASSGGSGQPASANLTNWSGVGTNQVVFVTDFQTYTNGIGVAYQPADAQLTNLALLSYSGNASKYIRVNAGETGFELATVSGGGATFDPNQFGTGGGNTNIKSGAVFTNTQNYSLTIRTGESLIFDAASQWQQYANPSSEILTFVNGSGSGMNLTTGGIEPLPSVAYTVGTASLPMTGVYATNGTFSGWMSVTGGFTNGGPAYLNGSVALGNASGDAITLSGTLEGTLQGEPIVSLTDTAIDFDFDKILFRDDNDGGTLKMGVAPAFGGDAGSGGTPGLVPAPAAGDAAALKFLKADGTWATPAGSGTLTSVTNAGNSSYSLINSSNSPVPAFKSLSAGSNVTLTDQGTNIVVAATGGGSSGVVPMAYTFNTISNSTTETDVISITITNNTFTTGKTLRVKLWGDFVKNTGGTENTTNMVKLGSTYMYKDSIGNLVNSANNRLPVIDIDLYAVSNTSQTVRMFTVYATGGTADIGDGDGAQSSVQRIGSYSGTASEDMTSGNKTFSFAVNFSGANTSLYFRPTQATVVMMNAP